MDWIGLFTDLIIGFNWFVLFYFLILNTSYLILFLLSLFAILKFVRRTFFSDYRQIMQSEMTWPISIAVPAYNEAETIVETVRSLLRVNYGEFEIIVINDGSTDGTLEALIKAFDLTRMDRVYKRSLKTKNVRGTYGSLVTTGLVVLDKERGGKSDALNAAINVSRYPLFCSIDADSVIEDNALLRVVKPFMEHPQETVAVGGIVRILNGCKVQDGLVTRVALPRGYLPAIQVVEYLRAFLSGRVGWSVLGSLLIISGAFGVYKKEPLIEIGGYSPESDTEDLDVLVRLHRHMRRRKDKYRVVFVPDPVCWTQAPTDLKTLMRQRDRWHRGMIQALWEHRGMLFNPRYGTVGMLAFPHSFLFEMMGPVVETLGYLAVILGLWLGIVNTQFLILFFIVSILYGIFLSVAAVLLEELSFRRYPGWGELSRLIMYSVLDNFGYRQLLSLFKVIAFWRFFRGNRHWDMKRSREDNNKQNGEKPHKYVSSAKLNHDS
jgi:cellulose synthase/poly-beta-1,6-N-acetylglucosamine synthase-like glycosyltransferase